MGEDHSLTDGSPDPFDDVDEQIEVLARQVTARSAKLHDEGHDSKLADLQGEDGGGSAISPTPGSKLDPTSPNFDSFLWMKALVNLYESDADANPKRMTGVAFKNLSVFGHSAGTTYQDSTGNILFKAASSVFHLLSGRSSKRIDILQDFEGIIEPGETLLVLGPPGSGCSTLLRTLSGRTDGLNITKDSYVNFRGINPKHMHDWFRSDVLYNAELDVHLAPLTVGDTLQFASLCRVPKTIPGGFTKMEFARAYRDAIMATFGIGHTVNTKVGDDFVRGVSGGERKRVSIAEAALSGAKFQCWDNSTRGLDSGNAISFCRTLRAQAELMRVAAVVAIYQAPQAAYEVRRYAIHSEGTLHCL